jgi:hypothetical protein
MKGPYERLKYTLCRVWECPACQHRERTAGTDTYLYCRCQQDIAWKDQACMRLVQDGTRRTSPPAASPPEDQA